MATAPFSRSMSFKVTEVGINWKAVCNFLLILILSRTVSKLSQINVQILDTLCFWATRWGLVLTYDVHVRPIRKRIVDFLLVLLELLLGVMAEAILAKIGLKIFVLQGSGWASAKFSRRRERRPSVIFARIVRPINALQYCYLQYSDK